MIGTQQALFEPAVHGDPAHFEQLGRIRDGQKLCSITEHAVTSVQQGVLHHLFHMYAYSNTSYHTRQLHIALTVQWVALTLVCCLGAPKPALTSR